MREYDILDPQNPIFCIKDNNNLYIQDVGHIWAYVHADSCDIFEKVLMDPIRPNV